MTEQIEKLIEEKAFDIIVTGKMTDCANNEYIQNFQVKEQPFTGKSKFISDKLFDEYQLIKVSDLEEIINDIQILFDMERAKLAVAINVYNLAIQQAKNPPVYDACYMVKPMTEDEFLIDKIHDLKESLKEYYDNKNKVQQ